MGTPHQFTVGRLLKAIVELKAKGKITNESKVVAGDNCGITVGKVEGVYEFGGELNIDYRDTTGEHSE